MQGFYLEHFIIIYIYMPISYHIKDPGEKKKEAEKVERKRGKEMGKEDKAKSVMAKAKAKAKASAKRKADIKAKAKAKAKANGSKKRATPCQSQEGEEGLAESSPSKCVRSWKPSPLAVKGRDPQKSDDRFNKAMIALDELVSVMGADVADFHKPADGFKKKILVLDLI